MIKNISNILDILDMLDIIDLQTYICSYKVSKDIYDYFLKNKKKFINKYFIPEIINSFSNSLINYPIIPFMAEYLDNNYYSNIDSNNIKYPISIGITNLNKPFILIKYNEYNLSLSKKNIKTALIIKRCGSRWSCAFSLKDYGPDISCIDNTKEYYLWYDDDCNKYKRSITNIILEKICKGEVIYIQHKWYPYMNISIESLNGYKRDIFMEYYICDK